MPLPNLPSLSISREFMRTALLLAGLSLTACETPGRIESADSMLDLRLAPGEWPNITRELTIDSTNRSEDWDWPSGALYVTRGSRGRYYKNDFAEPEDLIADIGTWGASVPSNFDRRSIFEDENPSGKFHYAVVNHGRRNCFYMLQAIPYNFGTRWLPPHSAEYSSGFISFYHCAVAGVLSEEKLEQRGLQFARALVRNW